MDEEYISGRIAHRARLIGDPDRNPQPHHVAYGERVTAQRGEDYLPPAFLKKTATPDEYRELESIFVAMREFNEEFAGDRTRVAQVALEWTGRTRPLQKRIISWARSYFDRRIARNDPKDGGDPFNKFHRLTNEVYDVTRRINSKGTLDYVFLGPYVDFSLWLVFEGSVKPVLRFEYEGSDLRIGSTVKPCRCCFEMMYECHRALQNQPLMGASKPANTPGGFGYGC